jgi:hypothetical protein
MKDIKVLEIVSERIKFLRDSTIRKDIIFVSHYKFLLKESERISIRVINAEMEALRAFMFSDDDLDKQLQMCIQNEQYCGAEGIKNAKQWLFENNLA